MKQSFSNDVLIRSIKLIDIGYISTIYIFFAIIISRIADKIMGEFDEKKESEKPFFRIMIEFIIIVWLYGVIVYIVRNLAELIPFPLNGISGFHHFRMKELGSASIFTLTFVLFCNFLKNKLLYFNNAIKQKIDNIDSTN
jgi:hypothetical protein